MSISQVFLKVLGPIFVTLLGLPAITGCDSVSSFSGRGKKAFNLLCKSSCSRTAMGLLGNEFSPLDTMQRECEKFVCLLYGQKDENYSVNDLPYKLFCSGTADSGHLPPIQDELRLHVARANYQAAI